MKKYRFKAGAGRHIGIVDGEAKALEPGEVVTLTENQALRFKDKFELVDGDKPDDEGKSAAADDKKEPVKGKKA